MSIFTKIIAFLMFVFNLISGMSLSPSNPTSPESNNTVMFISDFQGNDRETSFTSILDKIDTEPGLIVGGGDYQSIMGSAETSDFGITTLKNIVSEKWTDNSVQYLFIQGNHDPKRTRQLNETGLYVYDSYIIYLINEDDFPWQQGTLSSKKNTVKKTADELCANLAALVEKGETRPVFIVTHVPLHYTDRSNSKDNSNAQLLFDAISANADNLDIVFLFGHNHSGSYDNYIGGSVNYLAKGSTINIGGTNEEKTLNFTYMNCGYIGYSDNELSDTSTNILTATEVTICDSELTIQKYSKDGAYYADAMVIERNTGLAKMAA